VLAQFTSAAREFIEENIRLARSRALSLSASRD